MTVLPDLPNKTCAPSIEDLELDALREMGNIAAAHASTALSKLIGENIFIDVSCSHVFPVEQIPRQFDGTTDKFAAVYMNIGAMESNGSFILMVLPFHHAIWLSSKLLRKPYEPNNGFTDDDREALSEIGNICICAYLNAISAFIDETFLPSPPGVAVDMLGAILEFPAAVVGSWTEVAIVIETNFIHQEDTFSGTTLFIPDVESQRQVLARFGLEKVIKEGS